MIWGGRGNRKQKFGGSSPGKKIDKLSPRKKIYTAPFQEFYFRETLPRKKIIRNGFPEKNLSKFCHYFMWNHPKALNWLFEECILQSPKASIFILHGCHRQLVITTEMRSALFSCIQLLLCSQLHDIPLLFNQLPDLKNLVIDCVALVKEGDNGLGSVHPSVHLFVCLSVYPTAYCPQAGLTCLQPGTIQSKPSLSIP